jgi:hypothetical protein
MNFFSITMFINLQLCFKCLSKYKKFFSSCKTCNFFYQNIYIIVQQCNKFTISWNFNRIYVKIIKNMFVQNQWVSKWKSDTKTIYYLDTNDMFLLCVMSLCEVCTIDILIKLVNCCDVILDQTMQFFCIKHQHSRMSFKKINVIHLNI